MLRIYPIRTTKNQWNIYFYCKHKCATKCEYIVMSNDSTELVLEKNPDFRDGFCSKNLNIEKSHVRISSFDKDNPECCDGLLINSDEEVISDSSFTVSLYYPFSFIFDIFISSSEGFTLKELINAIKVLYKFIYDEEERTATPQTFSLKKVCSSCGIKKLSDYVENQTNNSNEEDCAICYETLKDSDVIKLKCDHIFHKDCIEKWIEKSGTCPLCRYNIFLCTSCSGKGIVYYQYSGVVVPLEQRGSILNRNRSNGLFGIHSYDFEDLVLKSMHYDNKNKKLFVEISG
jgi:hypothetical protein